MSNRSRIVGYSVLHPDFVSRFVRREWGWNRAAVELLNRSVNDCYRLVRGRQCAYLKIYRHGWRTRDEIQGEVALVRYLAGRGLRVARPIANTDGRFVRSINAPEGRRYAVLFSEAEGVMPEFNVENSRKYGLMAGTFHSATDLFPGSFRRPHLGIDHLAHEPLESIRCFLACRQQDLAYLTRIAGELSDAVRSLLPMSAPAFGMCHGDLTFGNVHRNGRGRLTLFDFDCSGYGWRAYDVAVFLQSRGDDFSRCALASRMRQWNAFMDGYHAVRRLSSPELRAVNLFVPLRQIWHLGMHTNHLARMESRSLRDAKFERRLEFIKNWLKVCKPL